MWYHEQEDLNLNLHGHENIKAHIFRQSPSRLYTTAINVIKYKQFQNFQGNTMKIQNSPEASM
jgi:hypothetical protein